MAEKSEYPYTSKMKRLVGSRPVLVLVTETETIGDFGMSEVESQILNLIGTSLRHTGL